MHLIGQPVFFPGLLDQHPVFRIVVGVQDGDRFPEPAHVGSPCNVCGNVMTNFAPMPRVLLAVILPLWRSTIFRQIARPMPVPSYSLRPCKRWKIWKMRSRYFSSKPTPLSSSTICHASAAPTAR
jgi:hypothetical protein